jgi:hypothetical protein
MTSENTLFKEANYRSRIRAGHCPYLQVPCQIVDANNKMLIGSLCRLKRPQMVDPDLFIDVTRRQPPQPPGSLMGHNFPALRPPFTLNSWQKEQERT